MKFNISHPFWTWTIKIKTLLCLGAPPQGRYLYQGQQRNTVCLDVEAEYNINESGPIHMGQRSTLVPANASLQRKEKLNFQPC